MRFLLLAVLASTAVFAQVHGTCAPCHNQHFEDFQTHKHFAKGISCDSCHGKSDGHVGAGGNALPDKVAAPAEQATLCGTCHTAQGKGFATSKHGKTIAARGKAAACTTCHGTHALRQVSAMINQCNRCHAELPASCKKDPPTSAKLACAGCHNPHTLVAKK